MAGNYSRPQSEFTMPNSSSSFEAKRKHSAVYFACISFFIIFGNSVTLCIAWKKKVKKPTDFLLGTLAGLDLITPLTEFPLLVIHSTFGVWLGGKTTCCLVALVSLFLWRFSMIVSTMITVDRFLAIAKPFFYRSKIRLRPTRVAVVIFGIYSFLIGVFPLVEMASRNQFGHDWWRCVYHWKTSRHHVLTSAYVIVNSIDTSLSVIVVSVCNVAVVVYFIKRNRKQSKNVGPEKNGSTRSRSGNTARKRSDLKYAKLMALVSFYSPLCVLPVQVLIILHHFGWTSISAQSISLYQLHVVAISLLVNPLPHALIRKHYRRAYWFIVRHPMMLCGVTSNGDFDFDAADNLDGSELDRKILNFREVGMTALATARFRLRMRQAMENRPENIIPHKGNQVAAIPTIVKRDYSLEENLKNAKTCPPCILMDSSDVGRFLSSPEECSEKSSTHLQARPNLPRNLSLTSSYFSDQESLPPSPSYLAVPGTTSSARPRTESNSSYDTEYSDIPSPDGLGTPKRLSFDNNSVFLSVNSNELALK